MEMSRGGVACAVLIAIALITAGLMGCGSDTRESKYVKFHQCPWKNTEVKKCIHVTTEGGVISLGNRSVPIENPATLQGGYGTSGKAGFARFFAATNGITLSKTRQPVPGGLFGIRPPGRSSKAAEALWALLFENVLTGVDATLELAAPTDGIRISELHLAEEEEEALKLPLKVHLENPLLGKNCYIGSSDSPILWELTTGVTRPSGRTRTVKGSAGDAHFLQEGRILVSEGAELVDNAWTAQRASGCGGPLSFLVDPLVNAQLGLSAAVGENAAVVESTIAVASSLAVKIDQKGSS